jgi:hypothetical protein
MISTYVTHQILKDPERRDTIPMDNRLYLMVGHGRVFDSNDFPNRTVEVPVGCTLVITSNPESIETSEGLIQLHELFTNEDNRDKLLHPELLKNMNWLKRNMSNRIFGKENVMVYTAGTKMPNLQWIPAAHQAASGLLQFPITAPYEHEIPGSSMDEKEFQTLSKEQLAALFQNSLYPTVVDLVREAEMPEPCLPLAILSK